MGKDTPKTIDGLMRYLRDDKFIAINGSAQKRKLRNIGYYHGYKGYRFINSPANKVSFTDFTEVLAIYNFDMRLKTLFYPQVMFVETALKNYVLEVVLDESNSNNFNTIFTKLLDDYKSYSLTGKTFKKATERESAERKYKDRIKKRLTLRDIIYKTLTRDYGHSRKTVQHFYHKDANVPIWAIFESLSLGEFGMLVSCLNLSVRTLISKSLGFRVSDDANGRLLEKIIYTLKDLRNSIAHNDVIFDVRFQGFEVQKQVIGNLVNSTGVSNINFTSVDDYLVLLVYLLKQLNAPKSDMIALVTDFEFAIEELRKQLPISAYNQIIPTATSNKLIAIKEFAKK